MMAKMFRATAVLGALLLGGAAHANLLTNGSFEAGAPFNNGTYSRGLLPTGWSGVAGIDVPDILGPGYNQTGAGFAQLLNAQDGSRYLDSNGASPTGAIYQDVTGLAPATALTLTFWAGQWAQNSAGTLTASLIDPVTSLVLGTQTLNFPYSPNATSSSWQQYTLNGVAGVSGSVRVRFDANSSSTSRGAPGLDNVVLLGAAGAVPEPATWAMLIGGFGVIGGAMRRRSVRAAIA
jgi:hypothetical protein